MNKLLLGLALTGLLAACQNTSKNAVEAGSAPEAAALDCCSEGGGCSDGASDCGEAKEASCGGCGGASEPVSCEGTTN